MMDTVTTNTKQFYTMPQNLSDKYASYLPARDTPAHIFPQQLLPPETTNHSPHHCTINSNSLVSQRMLHATVAEI